MNIPVIAIGVTYFGYFKVMEIISIKNTNLYNYVFQKADLVEDFDYY